MPRGKKCYTLHALHFLGCTIEPALLRVTKFEGLYLFFAAFILYHIYIVYLMSCYIQAA